MRCFLRAALKLRFGLPSGTSREALFDAIQIRYRARRKTTTLPPRA